MKGRKRSCPTNIRDWSVSVYDPAEEAFVRVRGLTDMTWSSDADTDDGSSASSLWEEPKVNKRSASLSLEGRPFIDASTGVQDPGQRMLTDAASRGGCDGDLLIRIADPYGRAMEAFYTATGVERSADSDGDTLSWDLEQIGEAESLPYTAVTGIRVVSLGEDVETVALDIGDAPRLLGVAFDPEDASNRRYAIRAVSQVFRISRITDGGFSVSPLKTGTGTIRVTSVSGGHSANVTVTVTDEAQPYMSGVLGSGMLGAFTLGRALSA